MTTEEIEDVIRKDKLLEECPDELVTEIAQQLIRLVLLLDIWAKLSKKVPFKHVQSVQIQIILHMGKVSSVSLLSIIHSVVSNDSGGGQ